MTAAIEGDFVVFRLGMRVNSLWQVHRWVPIITAVSRMIAELEDDEESGLLGYDTRLGIRNHESVQYWRSFEDLREYALDPESRHAPLMGPTNEQMAENAAVGIWHETYLVREGEYETVSINTPRVGLEQAGSIVPATDSRRTAAGRLEVTPRSEVEPEGEQGTEVN